MAVAVVSLKTDKSDRRRLRLLLASVIAYLLNSRARISERHGSYGQTVIHVRADTSWYGGDESTRNATRTELLRLLRLYTDSIFYSYRVYLSLDALMPCEPPSAPEFHLPCPDRDASDHHAPARLYRGCLRMALPFDPKRLRVAT